jgi:hypothetical protein
MLSPRVLCAVAAFPTAILSSGCSGPSEQAANLPPPGPIDVIARSSGRIDIADQRGTVYVRGAWAEALIDRAGEPTTFSTRESCPGGWTALDTSPSPNPYFSGLRGTAWTCERDGVGLRFRVYTDPQHDTALAMLDVENKTGSDLRVLRLTPLITLGTDGGLFTGITPLRHRILDNGGNVALDVEANLHYPDQPARQPILDSFLPILSRGDILSNWNAAVADLDSRRSFIAGALTVERAFPTIGVRLDPDKPLVDAATGRGGFHELVADQALLFRGKVIPDGQAIASEVLYLDPLAPDPWTGLEDYADAVAAWLDFTVWTKRGQGRPVPNGWNSWTGSSFTGGLGTDIDETILEENLAVMEREFQPFGIDYFQIDDGYQVADGDWTERADRFPSGMPALVQKIEDAGLLPGIWISAFRVSTASTLAAMHPDWLLDPASNLLGTFLSPGDNSRILDLSNPEAVAWLSDTMTRYKNDWRMRWIKFDFAYYALTFPPAKDPNLTSIEAYKRGIRSLRDALGDDVFYLGIALMGVNYGVVDGMRLTLDDGPRWEDTVPFSFIGQGGSFKSSVRTGARRYYLHNRVWITHNDLLFFRTDAEHPGEVVTMSEAMTFASFMALSGSIIKFGEDLRTLSPEQIDVWRKLLPSYPAAARPMDLFTRHYPELYRLDIKGTTQGWDAAWTVVGMLHWGKNFDFNANSMAELEEVPRAYSVALGDWGLDPEKEYLAQEFWTETFLGKVKGTLSRTVPPRAGEVIALREALGHPQFLGHNRHISQGGTDLAGEAWDPALRRLTLQFQLDAGSATSVPFPYRFRVYAPAGYRLKSAEGASATQQGEVVTLAVTPAAGGLVALSVTFE